LLYCAIMVGARVSSFALLGLAINGAIALSPESGFVDNRKSASVLVHPSQQEKLEHAIHTLKSHGGFRICVSAGESHTSGLFPDIPECEPTMTIPVGSTYHRRTEEKEELLVDENVEGAAFSGESLWEKYSEEIINGVGALVCISIAALAAGLTLGLLGIDPLLLLIKQRASDDPVEREQATKLLPIVKQHHRLLVTLLLMNAVANEALPIFLEALVPPSLAILFSVVFVLFFGEIIPSAIFTGPNQMRIASNLTPLVKTAMCLLYPIAMPIAKMLDFVLHDEDEGGSMYNRGELAALIRIQYEERLAAKRKRKQERRKHQHSTKVMLLPNDDHIGPIDFSSSKSFREEQRGSFRAKQSQINHLMAKPSSLGESERQRSNASSSERESGLQRYQYDENGQILSNSIHIDEVTMVEGALSMKVKCAMDVYTPLRRVFAIPDTTLLSESGIVKIHASGFSRIPVYHEKPKKKDNKQAIVGVLLTKQLIVINPEEKRPITSMPLYTPLCVGPNTPLVDLVNIFQTGGKGMTGGHMALVCARPKAGNAAFSAGQPLPETAGLMGIISFEDVLETILQEEIYDENDRYERNANILAKMVIRRWRRFVKKKKAGLLETSTTATSGIQPAIQSVVEAAVIAHAVEEGLVTSPDEETGLPTERTSLLGSLFGMGS